MPPSFLLFTIFPNFITIRSFSFSWNLIDNLGSNFIPKDLDMCLPLSDPDYPAYYFSNASKNPRLPLPMMSKEDWRFNLRITPVQSGVISSNNDGISERLGLIKEEKEKLEWLDKEIDGLIGLSIGRQKSLADIFQPSALWFGTAFIQTSAECFVGAGLELEMV